MRIITILLILLFPLSLGAITIEEIKKKAEEGDTRSQIILGGAYGSGRRGVKQDYQKSLKWYGMAAEQGYAGGQYNLGRAHYEGWGIKEDYKEAARLYRLAAEQGNAFAQTHLGLMYADGKLGSQDYKEAYAWASVSAIARNSPRHWANGLIDRAQNAMTSNELAQAKELAEKYIDLYSSDKTVKK